MRRRKNGQRKRVFVKRYIVVWRERQRDPEIIDTFEVE